MNYLMCSVGRRAELMKYFRATISKTSKIVATDNGIYVPALYFADVKYQVPKITDENYINILIDICKKESINAVTTFIDPEISLLAKNRDLFENIGIEVLAPFEHTAELCFDKFKMFKYLTEHNIPTVKTWGSFEEFKQAYDSELIDFPVFVKPRTGSGSVGARKVTSIEELKKSFDFDRTLIVQEFMDCVDLDADVYIDTISHKAVSVFAKKKLETRIGGASKTISFKDSNLFDFIQKITEVLHFNGPVDMDFFYKNGQYYLSEVNPRFGGAYLHAYGAGVNFIGLIENNLNGKVNEPQFGNYEDDVVMMMYDSVVICKNGELFYKK